MKSTQIIGSLAIVTALGLLSGCSQDDAAGATAGGASGNDSSSGNNGQIGNSQQTGKIAADGFYFAIDQGATFIDSEGNVKVQEVKFTVYADDINDLENVNGWTVNFKTEWGTFLDGKDSCVLKDGNCFVRWQTGSPATVPGSCKVSFTIWAYGEENFADVNDNGVLDVGEPFFDTQEPFLDINENGVFDNVFTVEGVPELIDIADFNGVPGRNGIHDNGNTLYDGSFCASDNAASCSGSSSVVIFYQGYLTIREPFTDVNDEDGDGDTSEVITYCGPNPG